MRTMLLASTTLVGALLFSAVPAVAWDDEERFPPGMMMGQGCGAMNMMGAHRMMGNRAWRSDADALGRLAYLKSELNITEAQAEAWKAYADAVATQALTMQTARKTMWGAMEKGSSLERLDARISQMDIMLQGLKSVKPAMQKLYDSLGAEQKALADDLMGQACGMM